MDVTAVVINYNTLDLTRRALESLWRFYPDLPTIVIDNGSTDESAAYVQGLARPNLYKIINRENLGHGPALHQGMLMARTPLVFTLDSDCEVKRGGWLEQMTARFEADAKLYALGEVCWTNDVGINTKPGTGIRYAHPSSSIYRRDMYFQLLPFLDHGAPCIDNMLSAGWAGLKVEDFPIRESITHSEFGTRSKFDWKVKYHPAPTYRPFLSFVTRTCKRPSQLLRCLESIANQTDTDYENVIIPDPVGVGVTAANGFFFKHSHRVHGQYVYLLDDDDILVEPELVETVKEIAKEQDWPEIVLFRVQHPSAVLPDATVWGKKPIGGKIGGSAFVVRADVWKRHIKVFGENGYAGDFAFIKTLFDRGYRAFWCDAIICRVLVQHQGAPE